MPRPWGRAPQLPFAAAGGILGPVTRGLGMIAATVAIACGPTPAYTCAQDDQCRLGGQDGVCVASECAYPDPSCESTLRYPDIARAEVAGACVPVDGGTGSTGASTTTTNASQTSTGVGTGTTTSSESSTQTDASSASTGPEPSCDVARIDGGDDHTCALSRGDVWCWGLNDSLQLGARGPSTSVPVRVPLSPGAVTELGIVGDDHGCAAVNGDEIWCWGEQDNTNVDGVSGPGPLPPTQLDITGPRHLSAGENFSCAALAPNVTCWGDTFWGQTGTVGGTGFNTILAGVDVDLLVSGGLHSCVRGADDGVLRCWGSDDHGQLGRGAAVTGRPNPQPDPMPPVGLPGPVDAVELGSALSCVLIDGRTWCWGRETSEQLLGAGTSSSPLSLDAVPDAIELSVGGQFACALTDAGSVHCWGSNGDGQSDPLSPGTGDGVLDTSLALSSVLGSQPVARGLATGEAHACMLTDDAVICWGRNDDGQLGDQAVSSTVARVSLPGCD